MKKYGCIGKKLGHSFSKEIHAKLFDYSYDLIELSPEAVAPFLKERAFAAVNVTIPYKQTVIPFLDEIDPIARKIGAVNTIVNRHGKLYGYNTDFAGMRALMLKADISPRGKKVLIAGSGGTSRTAAAVAEDLGAREIYRLSRTPGADTISYEDAFLEHADAEIFMNTTPVGMYPKTAGMAVSLDRLPALCGVIDAVYNPLRSALVTAAHERGIRASGGLYMLVAQAAYAAQHFVGESVPAEKIDEIYREILHSKENIVLVGMPGSGKSTVGRALADQMGRPFEDSDARIVEKYGDISRLFSQYGEAHFRQLEQSEIAALADRNGLVIATGGGAVTNAENISALRRNGKIYFLDRPLEAILPTDDRPLAKDRAALEARFKEREALYRAAGTRIDCRGSVADIAREIREDFTK